MDFVPAPLVVTQAMQTGAVLMDTSTGDCFELNLLGADVWNRLSSGMSLDAIVATICERYGVGAAQAHADLRALVDDLINRGLLIRACP